MANGIAPPITYKLHSNWTQRAEGCWESTYGHIGRPFAVIYTREGPRIGRYWRVRFACGCVYRLVPA